MQRHRRSAAVGLAGSRYNTDATNTDKEKSAGVDRHIRMRYELDFLLPCSHSVLGFFFSVNNIKILVNFLDVFESCTSCNLLH